MVSPPPVLTSPSPTTPSTSLSDDDGDLSPSTLRFLVSYDGKVLPRFPDAHLGYVGGDTRLLSVPSSTPFSELMTKMEELCGSEKGATLRCLLPGMDLDTLVTVRSDEDLANVVEEYEISSEKSNPSTCNTIKIRAFLHRKGRGKSTLPSPVRTNPTLPPRQFHQQLHQRLRQKPQQEVRIMGWGCPCDAASFVLPHGRGGHGVS